MRRIVVLRLARWMVLFGAIGFLACGDDTGDANRNAAFIYPDPDWAVETPEAHDLDSTLLEATADFADAHASDCLVVTKDGVIVGEWYWNGWTETTEQEVYSVSKSVTSALVGIAQDEGALDIRERASNYLTEWIGTNSEDVTIRNLISNDSGRQWNYIIDYVRVVILGYDKSALAIGLGQQHDPGTVWAYNNSAIQTLEPVLNRATGMDVAQYAEQVLFKPLGMMASSYGRDAAGNPLTFSGVRSSCRDLARFGYLYLRRGRWSQGQQIVSEDWVEESIQPSTPLNSAYGYMWWLNHEGRWLGSAFDPGGSDGRPMPNLPEEVFRASGFLNQIIFVDPGTDIVFTRMGNIVSLEDITSTMLVEGLAERVRAARLD
jgi:CubicO group peptidase (beta-lactamase class C family)